jgi:hypothetical protein
MGYSLARKIKVTLATENRSHPPGPASGAGELNAKTPPTYALSIARPKFRALLQGHSQKNNFVFGRGIKANAVIKRNPKPVMIGALECSLPQQDRSGGGVSGDEDAAQPSFYMGARCELNATGPRAIKSGLISLLLRAL